MFFLALYVMLTMRCGSQHVKVEKSTPILDETEEQIELLSGLWMSDSYLQKVEKTKSVYANKSSEPKILGFLLKSENLKSDSAYIFGFTSHEGGYEIPICFNSSKSKFAYDPKRINQSSNFIDPFELNLIDSNKLEIKFLQNNHSEVYRKVHDVQSELRRILFEGEFRSSDSKKDFIFAHNGTLTGFENEANFEVIYDFGLNIEFDAIVMYKGNKNGNWSDGEIYKFEFVSDTLKLYRVNTNWENMDHKIEDFGYKLKRIKSRE